MSSATGTDRSIVVVCNVEVAAPSELNKMIWCWRPGVALVTNSLTIVRWSGEHNIHLVNITLTKPRNLT